MTRLQLAVFSAGLWTGVAACIVAAFAFVTCGGCR